MEGGERNKKRTKEKGGCRSVARARLGLGLGLGLG